MRSDLQLAQRILELDSSDGPLEDDLEPVYNLAVELACRIVERERQMRKTYEGLKVAEAPSGYRRLSVVREGDQT